MNRYDMIAVVLLALNIVIQVSIIRVLVGAKK